MLSSSGIERHWSLSSSFYLPTLPFLPMDTLKLSPASLGSDVCVCTYGECRYCDSLKTPNLVVMMVNYVRLLRVGYNRCALVAQGFQSARMCARKFQATSGCMDLA